jgi:hypothetical protein
VLGDLGHRRPRALLAVLAQGWLPGVAVEGDATDGRMNACITAGNHGEAHVAGPGVPHEASAAGGVGAHLDRPAHQAGVFTGAVAGGDLGRQSGDGGVE